MKTTDKMILISGLVYGILFFQQGFGLNFFIFSTIQLMGISIISKKTNRNRNWWLAFGGVALTSVGVVLNGSLLAVLANILSLLLLLSVTIESKTSAVVGLFHAIYTQITGVIHIINAIAKKIADKAGDNAMSRRLKRSLLFVSSFAIALLFFSLYRSANDAFRSLTDQIDLSFISWDWIAFTGLGFYLIYNLYYQKKITKLSEIDSHTPDELDANKPYSESRLMPVDTERTWAQTLLIMLNTLLLIVLLSDIITLLVPEMTGAHGGYSDNVHQGVNSLLFSIVLAITIILFFFRGKLNFVIDNNRIKTLAVVWMAQNILLVLYTGFKNIEYIQEYFLTYKRIGVFFYLLCCVVGLFYTYLKIRSIKSNWFLVRRVGWGIYALFILTPLVDWDRIIINYNFHSAETHAKELDLGYLMSLPEENYPFIYEKLQESSFPIEDWVVSELEDFRVFNNSKDWRSFTFKKYWAYQLLNPNE